MRTIACTLLAGSLAAQPASDVRTFESTVESAVESASERTNASAAARTDVGRDLARAVEAARAPAGDADPHARLRVLVSAADTAARALGPTSLVGARLRALATSTSEGRSPSEVAGALAQAAAALGRIAADLRFEPKHEAPVPEGWPAPAPVGDVVVKDYPAYRMARAPMRSANDMSAFWKLFQHIQSKDIPMTAPVQMDAVAPVPATEAVGGEPARADAPRSMAFLYESPQRGPTGDQGRVEVVDVPAARWASIGARGYDDPDRLENLCVTLRSWLAEHAPRYEVIGPMRKMGWNSPSVRGDRRFFEVELPVRLRRDV